VNNSFAILAEIYPYKKRAVHESCTAPAYSYHQCIAWNLFIGRLKLICCSIRTAINLPGQTIKSISAAAGIRANTLYKRNTTSIHLSPEKTNRLLLYFIEYEPKHPELADTILHISKMPEFVVIFYRNHNSGIFIHNCAAVPL